MRKKCNFTLPRPFVVLSRKNGLVRNNLKKYIIYPDLSKFKRACLNCPHIKHKDRRYSCKIGEPDFMVRFYGIGNNSLEDGIVISQGTIPLDLKPHPLAMEIEAYINYHRQKSKKRPKVEDAKQKPLVTDGKASCFTSQKSKLVAW